MKEALAQLFDRRVASHAVAYSTTLEPLFDDEAKLVERAVEKRRHEFRAGRHCARVALRALALPAGPILAEENRAPRWPSEAVGSITHTGDLSAGYAAAVVAPKSVARGLGVDLESDTALSTDLWERILTPRELAFLHAQPAKTRGLLGKLFFSAKEAFYKCQYPVTQRFLEFKDVELSVDLTRSSFRVSLCCDADARLKEMAGAHGRFFIGGGLVLTGTQLLRAKSS